MTTDYVKRLREMTDGAADVDFVDDLYERALTQCENTSERGYYETTFTTGTLVDGDGPNLRWPNPAEKRMLIDALTSIGLNVRAVHGDTRVLRISWEG